MLGESSPSLNQNNVHVKVFFNTDIVHAVCELSVVSWMCGTVLTNARAQVRYTCKRELIR